MAFFFCFSDDIEFPVVFKICLSDYSDKMKKIYEKYGYENEEKMYLGLSRHNASVIGWSGHKTDEGHFNVEGQSLTSSS